MKLKICGMKYPDNIKSVAALQPDYLGFIFYEKSKRHFNGVIPEISESIKKTGVFVNATIDFILEKVDRHNLNTVQLHGDESPKFCKELFINQIEVIKVFSVGDNFDFKVLDPYDEVCDYFLFDTKGKERGGNGITFNWNLLQNYSGSKPYFLSGGIGLEEVEDLKYFLKSTASKYCYAIDVNSKFEMEPGLKIIEKLKIFIKNLEL
jgi:phosphoribosylanthranilate isomerase